MQTYRTKPVDTVRFGSFRPLLRLSRFFHVTRVRLVEDDLAIMRRELERVRSLSPHLLADIGIDCGQSASMDEIVQKAHRLKSL